LAHQKPADVDMTAEETCMLTNYDEKARNLHATGKDADDDDDDEERVTARASACSATSSD